ncbi:MAG: SRPBCC family protein [Nitrospira sp.]|nr:SRPBCC family protein [Nitrospira sp.]
MTIYHFVTNWCFPASRERVWEEIVNVSEWPSWWASWKKAVAHDPASRARLGSVVDHEVQGRLPYTLRFKTVVTVFEPPRLLTVASSGDLIGTGTFALEPLDDGTAVTYRWDVGLSNPLLNVLGRVSCIRALMEKNHDAVMDEGYRGLKRRLER